MRVSRATLWSIVAVSGLVFAGSAFALALRVAAFNRRAGFVRYSAVVKDERRFTLPAYPPVTLTDATDESGRPILKLEYGSLTRPIPVKAPPATNLPNLAAYSEWVKVLAINEVGLDAAGHSAAKPGTERLFIVVRQTPEGFNPDTWGSVRRDEWLFDFYELLPDGSVEESTRRWPRDSTGMLANREKQLQEKAAQSADQRLKDFAAIPPLEERSPEYFAAMHVIPKLNVPKHKFSDTALNWRVLGWTLPVSMLSGLVLIPALFFAVAAGHAPAKSIE